jgi:hypothetical protein
MDGLASTPAVHVPFIIYYENKQRYARINDYPDVFVKYNNKITSGKIAIVNYSPGKFLRIK